MENKRVDLKHERQGRRGATVGLKHPKMESDSSQIKEASEAAAATANEEPLRTCTPHPLLMPCSELQTSAHNHPLHHLGAFNIKAVILKASFPSPHFKSGASGLDTGGIQTLCVCRAENPNHRRVFAVKTPKQIPPLSGKRSRFV